MDTQPLFGETKRGVSQCERYRDEPHNAILARFVCNLLLVWRMATLSLYSMLCVRVCACVCVRVSVFVPVRLCVLACCICGLCFLFSVCLCQRSTSGGAFAHSSDCTCIERTSRDLHSTRL